MGYRLTLGRVALGLLMIVQGIILMQGGFKEQQTQMRELRSYLVRNPSILSSLANITDSTLKLLVMVQSVLMLISGALVIANIRVGGLIMSMGMLTMVATRDNPLLGTSDLSRRHNFQNMLKDLAVVGMGILIFMRKQTVVHRRQGDRRQPIKDKRE